MDSGEVNILRIPLLAAWIAAGVVPVAAADISGTVLFKGVPPPEKTIVMDAESSKTHPGVATTRHFVVGKDGGLANVFVYVSKGLEGKKFSPSAKAAELDQAGCMYEPYVQGVMAGQILKIKNSDPLLHNVHSITGPSGNQGFNFAQPLKGQMNEKTFTKPEVMVKFKCDVHNWMFAYVGVMDHPYFAVTGKDGKFTITNLPPGDYSLTAYHQKTHGTKPGLTQRIKVEEDKTVTADFTVELTPIK